MCGAEPQPFSCGRFGRRWLELGLLGLLGACASPSNPWIKPVAAVAAQPGELGPLVQLEAGFVAAQNAAQSVDQNVDQSSAPSVTQTTTQNAKPSGFRLLERNAEGLKWRLALIDQASQSLDLQYYVWLGDASGQLLMARVIAAAERGVKVRILFDDLSTMLRRMAAPELRDEFLSHIDSHPNIQIRTFNAWTQRDWVGRVLEGASDFGRLNRRMHNKQMIVDNRVTIMGGRNVGDEYFGMLAAFNFHDLDVLGVGPVARQASAVFDRYWNSDWVRAIEPQAAASPKRVSAAFIELPQAAADNPALQELLAGRHSWALDLAKLGPSLVAGSSEVHTDAPSRAEGVVNHMPEAFRALMHSAQQEVLISNAYIIPDAAFINDLAALNQRGVKVRVLTNSLASHDVPAVNAHYEDWRKPILQTGTELFELRPDAAIKAYLVDSAPVRSAFIGLHTKAMVIDRRRSFIGSMNLDPRSEVINSEMGVIIDSPALSATLAAAMMRDMSADNSWALRLTPAQHVQWTGEGATLDQAPARSPWQRFQSWLFKLLPASYY